MFKSLVNAWKIPDLRKKLLYTLLIIVVFRIGSNVMVPFINYQYVEMVSTSQLGFLNILGGSAFSNATLFALGVSPYITTSIIMQLLAVAIPALERLSKSEDGKQKMAAITRYVTVVISIVTAIGYYLMLKNYSFQGIFRLSLTKDYGSKGANFFIAVVIIACFVAGSSLVMWLAERINEKGIGNGVSIILFVNIISRAPQMLTDIISVIKVSDKPYENGYSSSSLGFTAETSFLAGGIAYVVGMALFVLFLLWFIVHISDSERRIPIQYAKRVVGRKMYGGQNTNLPIKLNMAGVMPIIFASSILGIPQMILMFIPADTEFNPFWQGFFREFTSGTSVTLIILNLILILAFAYFYVAISFNPNEVAGNIQKNGGSIPGIRPGKPTADFVKKVLSKITFIGAAALAVIAVLPLIIQIIVNAVSPTIPFYVQEFVQSGTSIIIVVGVILETLREIESQLSMRHYKGFLE